MAKHKRYEERPKAWLWWMAMFVGVIGGGLAYLIKTQGNTADLQRAMLMTLAVTVVVVGVCVISATADWWLKR